LIVSKSLLNEAQTAQGIAAASFLEEKDIAESPTRRDAPSKKTVAQKR